MLYLTVPHVSIISRIVMFHQDTSNMRALPALPPHEWQNPSGDTYEHIQDFHADIANLTSNAYTYELVSEHLISRPENQGRKTEANVKSLAALDSVRRIRGNGMDEDIYASASDLNIPKHEKRRQGFPQSRQGIGDDTCGQIQHAYLDVGDMLSSAKHQCNTRITGIAECLESFGNGKDSLSIKSNNTDAESESNSKFQHAYLDLGDFLSDDTPTTGRGVAVNNDFPSSDVSSNDRETIIDHLYFTSEEYQADCGTLLHFRHTDSDDEIDDFTDKLEIRKKSVPFKSGREEIYVRTNNQDKDKEEASFRDPRQHCRSKYPDDLMLTLEKGHHGTKTCNVGVVSDYLVPDAHIQQISQAGPSSSCTDEISQADTSSDIYEEPINSENEDASFQVSSLDDGTHPQNLVISADKLDCEYAEIPDSLNLTHTYFDSPLNDDEEYMVPNAESVLDNNTVDITAKDTKVVYEEVDNFEPKPPRNINAKPSLTSVSMTPNKDADYDSSSQIQHTYFGFSDLQAENSISPGKKEQDENGGRKDIKHTFTTPDPELKDREQDIGSSFTLYSTIDEAKADISVISKNDNSQEKCETHEDDFGYLVLE